MTADRKISRTPKGQRPQYFADPATDKLLTMVVTLASELSVTRDRLDAVERILQQNDLLDRTQVDNFEPDEEADLARQSQRQILVERLLQTVTAELDETLTDLPASREALLKELER